jgi:hypothetical protein
MSRLVIAKSTAYFSRPKYYPKALWECWVVLEVGSGKRVHGPSSLISCNKYLLEQDKKQ